MSGRPLMFLNRVLAKNGASKSLPFRSRPRLEWLEDRLVPSLLNDGDIVVTNFVSTFGVDRYSVIAVNPSSGTQTVVSNSAYFSTASDITEAPSSWGYG